MPGVPFFGKGTIIINIGILETPSLVPLHLLNIHLPVRYFSYIKIFLFLTVNVLVVSTLPLKVVGQEKISLLGDVLANILSLVKE